MIVVTHLLDVAHFQDSPVNITVEAIAELLCHVTQMQVVVGNLTQVDMLAEIGIGGVGGTIKDRLGIRQVAISALSCGGTSKDSYFELPSCLMFGNGDFC